MIAAHAPDERAGDLDGPQAVDPDRQRGRDETDEREREQRRAAERERGAHSPVVLVAWRSRPKPSAVRP